jgi:hypothetical protein
MNDLANSSSGKPIEMIPPTSLIVLAALALSATTPTASRVVSTLRPCIDYAIHSTASYNLHGFDCVTAGTELRALSIESAATTLSEMFLRHGLKVSRVGRTSDRSVLFQFLEKTKACVDLYPNGELIVVVRHSNKDEVHELDYADAAKAIEILRDAGIHA